MSAPARDADAVPLPWAGRADHHCFGCAPATANPRGLSLTFERTGDRLGTAFVLDHHYESYPGVVHGGILGLICDETMGNLVVLRLGVPALTTSMRMRYLGVVSVGHRYRCTAEATEGAGGLLTARAEVLDEHGTPVATATAHYQPHQHAVEA
ncbi:putative thioesterase family protein [Streptomyces himastatinicus ATCC 53653]|uniref:Putative thioesterase family protein n=1 Tax=Streptomyces himastatinicus ATCC 53653 TaxID=457427 RepID=D9WQH2_9ACTN|nr:PaaI family thioesterase [Streptomyces himastatinicus]EFL28105.1 putative thioesterase family protein [Streptomyces himastatinicus ATCC 53653]